eukprot:1196012-Prorocentrum_minimum.AAC.2
MRPSPSRRALALAPCSCPEWEVNDPTHMPNAHSKAHDNVVRTHAVMPWSAGAQGIGFTRGRVDRALALTPLHAGAAHRP